MTDAFDFLGYPPARFQASHPEIFAILVARARHNPHCKWRWEDSKPKVLNLAARRYAAKKGGDVLLFVNNDEQNLEDCVLSLFPSRWLLARFPNSPVHVLPSSITNQKFR